MHPIDLASFWPGYEVVACRQATHDTLLISLEPLAEHLPICSRYAKPCPLIHERRIRQVRDRDLLDQRVLLQLPVRRVDCLSCGQVIERIAWLEPAPQTQRLRIWLESLLQLLPISRISGLTGLHWHTLKTLDKRRLKAGIGNFGADAAHRLMMGALHMPTNALRLLTTPLRS